MELGDYLRFLRRYWVSIIAVTLAGVGAGIVASLVAVPVYAASASVIFTLPNGASPGELNSGATYMATQVRSYVELANSPLVLDPVIRRVDLSETADGLASRITASNPTGTAIVRVEVSGADRQQAAAIANEVANELIAVVGRLAPKGADGAQAVSATMVAPASVPTAPRSPGMTRNIVVGAVAALLIALSQAALRNRRDSRGAKGRNAAVEPGEGSEAEPAQLSPQVVTDDETDAPESYREALAQLQRSVNEVLARLG